jgi:alpha-glucosidase (family GH31 glycosyl hydrolase)
VFADPYKSYMRTALNNRLTLVPYLYTLFSQAHAYGDTVTRPLFFEFPADANVAALDTQVMLGPALMISPVLQQGAVNKTAYFPSAIWYDWYSGAAVSATVPGWNSIPAPLSMIPVHIRGGYVVPTQDPNMTTTFSALNAFRLTIALAGGTARGELYLDDGDSLNTFEMGQYTLLSYAVNAFPDGTTGQLIGTLEKNKFSPAGSASLQSVRVLGVASFNSGNATVNDQPAQFVYDSTHKVLTVNFSVLINADVSVQWTSSQ